MGICIQSGDDNCAKHCPHRQVAKQEQKMNELVYPLVKMTELVYPLVERYCLGCLVEHFSSVFPLKEKGNKGNAKCHCFIKMLFLHL